MKIPLIGKILIGFVLGTAIGLAFSEFCAPETTAKVLPWIAPFGNVLVAMLKMVVYPIILFSLIIGAASLPLKKSGKVGGMVLVWYLATSVFATAFGVALAYLMNPSMANASQAAGSNMDAVSKMSTAGGSGSFGTFLVGLFQNPFAALANGQFLPIIVFSIGFGLCARWILDSSETDGATRRAVESAILVCDGAQKISFKMIDCVVHYFPIGVFALSVVNFAENGVLLFGPYAKITLCVVVGVVSMILVVYPLALALFCRVNPYRVLMRMRRWMVFISMVTPSNA